MVHRGLKKWLSLAIAFNSSLLAIKCSVLLEKILVARLKMALDALCCFINEAVTNLHGIKLLN